MDMVETPKVAGMDPWNDLMIRNGGSVEAGKNHELTHSWVKIHRYPDYFDVKKGY